MNIFRILLFVLKVYEFFLGVDDWEFVSWYKELILEIMSFY